MLTTLDKIHGTREIISRLKLDGLDKIKFVEAVNRYERSVTMVVDNKMKVYDFNDEAQTSFMIECPNCKKPNIIEDLKRSAHKCDDCGQEASIKEWVMLAPLPYSGFG